MGVRVKFTGGERIAANMRRVARGFRPLVAEAQKEELQIEVDYAIIPETPKKTGALRSTIHLEGPNIRGSFIETAVVAGGPEAPYAVIVHEDLEAYHPIGGPKYIERPLNQSAPFMAMRIGRRVDLKKLVIT